MENSVIKFSLRPKNAPIGDDPHYDYCCNNRIPYVTIRKGGTKYWKVDYNILPLTMFERFVIIDYTDHTIPFYDKYCQDFHLPIDKKSYSGSGGCLMFTVFKEDSQEFADRLFDLLVVLSKKDQEMFDKNPVYISVDGFSPEGFKVASYVVGLEKLSDKQLIYQYNDLKKEKPFWKQKIQLTKNELDKRKIVVD